MSNEKFTSTYIANVSICPKLIWMNNSRIRLKFKGSCLKQDKAVYTPKIVVNLFIVYELDIWSRDININFTFKNCLFGPVKLPKNVNPEKCKYSGYRIVFDSHSSYLLHDNTTRRNVTFFGTDMNSSVDIDNKGKEILILGDRPTQRLDDTTLTAEAIYSLNFTQSNRKFSLSLHYLLMLQKCISTKQKILK